MTIIYRETDPISGRWTANSGGIDLSAFQIDQNFYECVSRIATLEANESFTVSIDYITIAGDQLTFHMTNHTLQGPFTLPVATFNDTGAWQPFHVYAVNDTFSINGTLYDVIWPHTSAATFSAGANDGMGHNYYSAMLSLPGNSLPTGGATGQVLGKTSSTDFAVSWIGWAVPSGGTTGQSLRKVNNTDGNTHWTTDELANMGDVALGSPLTSGQVLTYNGTHWTNTNAPTITVTFAEISDIALGSPLTTGQVLQYNGTHWTNATAAGVTNFYALSDVNVSEGPGINGYTVAWNNSTGFWEAVKPYFRNPTMTTLGASGTTTLDPSLGDMFKIYPTGNVTINCSASAPGADITVFIYTSGTSSFNVTFGSNFKSQGVLATGTVSGKVFTVMFKGDDGAYGLTEISRTAAM